MNITYHKPTVLDWFRANSSSPLIQYLTWYLILVLDWNFEDMTMIEIGPVHQVTSGWGIVARLSYRFSFYNKPAVTLSIVQTSGGKFYVEHSTSIVVANMDTDEHRLS